VSEVDENDAREAIADYKAVVSSSENSNDEENDELRKEIEQLKQETPIKTELLTGQEIGKFIVEDGLATDIETGLTWLRFSYGQNLEGDTVTGTAIEVNGHDVMKIPLEFNQKGYSGYNDWRVPSIEELKTLMNEKKADLDTRIFYKSGKCECFWSSTLFDINKECLWYVYFGEHNGDISHKQHFCYIRLVRG
jgi:hypothetical protein